MHLSTSNITKMYLTHTETITCKNYIFLYSHVVCKNIAMHQMHSLKFAQIFLNSYTLNAFPWSVNIFS